MPPLYSPIVDSILQEWVKSLQAEKMSEVEIDTEIIEAISDLIIEGKISSLSEIRQAIENLERKNAAENI